MARFVLVVLLVLLALAGATGCRCGTLTQEEFDRAYPLAGQIHLSRHGLAALETRLRARIGWTGEKIRARRLDLSKKVAWVEVEDPRRPGTIDRYELRKSALTASPLSLDAQEQKELQGRLFDLDAGLLAVLPRVAREALSLLRFEGGQVESVKLGRVKGRVRISVSVRGTRRSGALSFDTAGKVEVEERY